MLQTMQLQAVTPEIREALATMMRHDSSPQLRLDARIQLARLAPGDPALASASAMDADAVRAFAARLDRNAVTVPELVTALADRWTDPAVVIQQLPKVGEAYWAIHLDEKMLVTRLLASMHRDPDVRIYEAASDAYSRLNHAPRPFYSIDELEPYFAVMESSLTRGEYDIAMRDLKSSLESYWQARRFIQAEPTHLPSYLVQILLVGPAHQNPSAYQQMLRAIRQVDPDFQPPQ